jgi:hypothetical protein
VNLIFNPPSQEYHMIKQTSNAKEPNDARKFMHDWIGERLEVQSPINAAAYAWWHDHYHSDKPKPTVHGDGLDRYFDRREEREERRDRGELQGLTTGLSTLDSAIGGQQGVTIIAGDTQVGKTSLASQIALTALQHDPQLAVAYHVFDDLTKDDLLNQLLCSLGKLTLDELDDSSLSDEKAAAHDDAQDLLFNSLSPRLDVLKSSDYASWFNAPSLFGRCSSLALSCGATRVLTIIDMLDDMPLPKRSVRDGKEVASLIRDIRRMPDEWRLEQLQQFRDATLLDYPGGWPMIVVSKVRKARNPGQRLCIKDILGRVETGYFAKQILLMEVDSSRESDDNKVPILLSAAKARHGTTTELSLDFHFRQFRFEEAHSNGKASARSSKPTAKKPRRPPVNAWAGLE